MKCYRIPCPLTISSLHEYSDADEGVESCPEDLKSVVLNDTQDLDFFLIKPVFREVFINGLDPFRLTEFP